MSDDSFRLEVYDAGGFDDLAPSFDFIEGMLCDSSVGVSYGPPGCGKTFLAIHLLCCAATAREPFGLKVEQRNALYVGLEGEASIKARIEAWMIENKERKNPIHYALGSMNLIDEENQDALIEIIRQREVRFVVIDTLSMAATGIDENSAEHMTLIIEALHNIKRETGACVVAIAHTGKNEKAGIRGHSSQRGNVDTIIEIETLNQKARKAKRGEPEQPEEAVTLTTQRRATVRKQRDGADGQRVQFRLALHETRWRNARGEQIRSVAVSESEFKDFDAIESADIGPTLTPREREALAVLDELTAKNGRILGPPTIEQLRRALKAAKWGPANSSSWRTAFQRFADKLDLDSNGGIERVH